MRGDLPKPAATSSCSNHFWTCSSVKNSINFILYCFLLRVCFFSLFFYVSSFTPLYNLPVIPPGTTIHRFSNRVNCIGRMGPEWRLLLADRVYFKWFSWGTWLLLIIRTEKDEQQHMDGKTSVYLRIGCPIILYFSVHSLIIMLTSHFIISPLQFLVWETGVLIRNLEWRAG